jgi:hypothetical protein
VTNSLSTGINEGRSLAVHEEGRAMVHKEQAGNEKDECWMIVAVEREGFMVSYSLMKTQVKFESF